VSEAEAVAAVLWLGATLYAVFGGADFGVGFWDLLAGDAERGERPRALMDKSLAPVWEANHVWLIFCLVVLWTAFSDVFAAIMSTLFVPLTLAALGIVLRGAGFAFRHAVDRVEHRRAFGALFALSSLLTPFFMGTVIGGIASGRVPAGGGGDRLTSWVNASSVAIGMLFVATSAYLAAVFLVSDARRAGEDDLVAYFRRRALWSGAAAGVIALATLGVLREDARFVFDGLTGDALPLVVASAVAGAGALALLVSGARRGARPLAVIAVATVVWGWAVAQHPYLLPTSTTIDAAAAGDDSLVALLVVFGAAVIIVVPALALLYMLHQRSTFDGLGSPADRRR
jgi:cytochrome bd ubiquinol oxidase subunit II